ncbi:MAG: hypothetical protein GKR94_32440 [Gammaproteobacteria bacterium]|nr:hypothetical protein [Gammaproteobacteria bacterium]
MGKFFARVSETALGKIVLRTIVRPMMENVTLVLILGGALLTFVGATLGTWLDAMIDGAGDAAVKGGSAILGAGIFAAIMKSAQFTDLFKEQIQEVFRTDSFRELVQGNVHEAIHNPQTAFGVDDLKDKWLKLTQSLLRSILPSTHLNASQRIMEQFLDAELHYHFTEHEIRYEISVQEGIASITDITRTKLVIAPNAPEPVFSQELTVEGTCLLKTLIVNGEPIVQDGRFVEKYEDILSKDDKADDKAEKEYKFRLPLERFLGSRSSDEDRVVTLERSYDITQSIESEPYLIGTMKRFVKGLTVGAKISGDYDLYFTETGLDHTTRDKPINPYTDSEEYTCWKLANPDELLLPGQGYAIILLKKNSDTAHT